MEKQTIWYELEFQVEHNPGNEAHLRHVADTYFTRKGVKVVDSKIIV